MITVNLNETWTVIQLISFRKVMGKLEWESHPEKAIAYSRMINLYKDVIEKRQSRQLEAR